MLSPQQLLKGIINRLLPPRRQDGTESEGIARMGTYSELYVGSLVRKQHLLADEGSYFVLSNNQTGILTGTTTAYSNAAATLIVTNTDVPTNPNAKRIYLDYIDLLDTSAGVTATASGYKAIVAVVDNGNRYSSGGTNLTSNIVNPNMDTPQPPSIVQAYFGALTATSPSNAARTVCGLRLFRIPASATAPDLLYDRHRIEFGSVEPISSSVIGGASVQTNTVQEILKLPPVIIGPGQSFLLSLIQNGATTYSTGTTYAAEVGGWIR